MIKEDRYKLALFHVYAPYAKKYYEEGELKLPDECKSNFAQMMNENDPYAEFFDEHIQEDVTGLLWKKDIMNRVRDWKEKNVPRWSEVKQEFQKRKYRYDSQKQVHNKETKKIIRDILLDVY